MTDVLCCKSCGHPLQIVCPEHGTDYVPDRRVNLVDDAPAPGVERRQGERRGGLVAMVSNDPARPSSIAELARATDKSYANVSVQLSGALKAGTVTRVGKGLYVRTVRPSPEPAHP